METPKKLFIFQEMKLTYTSGNRNYKQLLIFQQTELFKLEKQKEPALETLLIFPEMEHSSTKIKKCLILSYTFLYFKKLNFLALRKNKIQELTFRAQKV